jgi:hypothetical protein
MENTERLRDYYFSSQCSGTCVCTILHDRRTKADVVNNPDGDSALKTVAFFYVRERRCMSRDGRDTDQAERSYPQIAVRQWLLRRILCQRPGSPFSAVGHKRSRIIVCAEPM